MVFFPINHKMAETRHVEMSYSTDVELHFHKALKEQIKTSQTK